MGRRIRFHFHLAALTLVLGMPLVAADQDLLWDKESILPLANATRPGGVVPYGNTVVTKEGDLIVGQNDGGDVGLVRWFPNHLRLAVKDFSDPKMQLLVELEGSASVHVKAAWRSEKMNTGAEIDGVAAPGPDGTLKAVMPLPTLDEGTTSTGIYLAFPGTHSVRIKKVAIVLAVDLLLQVSATQDPWKKAPLTITGRGATPGSTVRISIKPATNSLGAPLNVEVTAAADGGFQAIRDNGELIPGDYEVSAEELKGTKTSSTVPFFVFPILNDQHLPAVRANGAKLMAGDKPFAFVGVNYSPFLLDFARHADYLEAVRNLVEMHNWGVRVIRVTFNMSLIQPDEGIFPDDPKWAGLIQAHQLDPEIVHELDYFVQVAGQMNMYCVFDWHAMPTSPYDYHAGGQPSDEAAGKPGTAIAWLAPSNTKTSEFDPTNAKHRRALLAAHTWIASHFKGNNNLMGIEIPYNEPHDPFMAVEKNWRKLTSEAALAVRNGDPDRMTFTMPSAYGHDNLSASGTWLPPDVATGAAPHFYLANGPVPLRPDAKNFAEPYLAHDAAATFGYAQASVFLPFAATDFPIYNGESGEYGNGSFLPNEKFPDRAEPEIEAQMVQGYAAGWSGVLEWTLWSNPGEFTPFRDIYAHVFKRFAPVFADGPVDRTQAQVAFVQSPGAVPPQNGMNYACVPFAKLALELHLQHVHYFTDAQFLYQFRASIPTGLEQVVEGIDLTRYKAIVIDRRNLDTRAIDLAKNNKVPVLWTDDADTLTVDAMADFLKKNGVDVDTRTPQGLQIIEGPGHLLVYNRDANSAQAKVYPALQRAGTFRLVDESGNQVYQGSASTLAQSGFDVSIPRWHTAIYTILEGN